jgi:hypothetical protein
MEGAAVLPNALRRDRVDVLVIARGVYCAALRPSDVRERRARNMSVWYSSVMVKLIYLGRTIHLKSFLTRGERFRLLTYSLLARSDM